MFNRFFQSSTNWFSNLASRERWLIFLAASGFVLYGIHAGASVVLRQMELTEVQIKRRHTDLENLNSLLFRYQQLRSKLKRVENTFTESEMTFEQATSELDRIIRDSLGSSDYDLNKTRTPSDIGLEFEKQEFTVKVKSIKLNQLVSMLHKLENGDSPLFIGKLDVTKSPATGDFAATLEIFSIRKKA